MILPSKYNISVARAAYFLVSSVRKAAGLGDIAIVKRGGINWVLDLREGIDLTIYLTGYFEHRVIEACCRNIGPGHTALDIGANMGLIHFIWPVQSAPPEKLYRLSRPDAHSNAW
jgi:hypothetical protein